MNVDLRVTGASDWATTSGDVWAEHWQDTDRGLGELAPHLLAAIVNSAPKSPFTALEVGCGPGSSALAVAEACPQAHIVACDISPPLVNLARQRAANVSNISVVLGDAEAVAGQYGQFDLTFSRHGVMFFSEPVRAFAALRGASVRGASLIFSCFQAWEANPWASELAREAAGRQLAAPGREPGGFAFAEPDYVRDLLSAAGWADPKVQAISFRYVAGTGPDAVASALSFLANLGPASRVLGPLSAGQKRAALDRMRRAIESNVEGAEVVFPAAAWIWQVTAR